MVSWVGIAVGGSLMWAERLPCRLSTPLSGSSPGSAETAKRGLSPAPLLPNHFLSLLSSCLQHLGLPSAFALCPNTIIYLFIPFSFQHSHFSRFVKKGTQMAPKAMVSDTQSGNTQIHTISCTDLLRNKRKL